MNHELYRKYLREYIQKAINHSDATNTGISSYLWEQKISGFLVLHKLEKQRALEDARKAFDEHRHWPQNLVLSHLGIDDLKFEE